MANQQVGSAILALLLLMLSANLLGQLFMMFVAGAAAKHLLGKENRKATAFILGLRTPLPFLLALLVAPALPLEGLMGTAGSESAVVLVFAAAAAVTSIPVITKIFADIGILHTRCASLQLGSPVPEDIGRCGVLSIASAIAAAELASIGDQLAGTIGEHIFVNAAFVLVALFVMPFVLRKLSRAQRNVLAENSLTAVFTSQACGFWLQHVLRKGWPLLSGDDLRRRGKSRPRRSPSRLLCPLWWVRVPVGRRQKLPKFP